MQVDELFSLTQWIASEVKEAALVAKYEQLQHVLQQNAQPSQEKQPFEEQRMSLTQALLAVPLQTLTNEQLRFLECIGIGEHVGRAGLETVEDVLIRNPIDPATAANKLRETIESIEQGIARSERLANDLEDCVTVDTALGENILVRVKFAGDAAIDTVVDLKKWADLWHGIVRGIAMANSRSPDEVRVVGAGRGSLLIDLASPDVIAVTVAGVVLAALKLTERVQGIFLKAQEIKAMKLGNEKIASELEAEAKQEEAGGVQTITAEFTAKLKIDSESAGDVVTALAKSVTDLVGFLRRGGEVDCVIPEQAEEDAAEETEHRRELRLALGEIRELESRLRLLAAGSSEDPDQDV